MEHALCIFTHYRLLHAVLYERWCIHMFHYYLKVMVVLVYSPHNQNLLFVCSSCYNLFF